MEFTYSGLSVDPVENRMTIYDVFLRPRIGYGRSCDIRMDQLTLKGAPWNAITELRLSVEVTGVKLSRDCLPSEAAPALAVLRVRDLSAPRGTLDLRYDLPSGRAEMLVDTIIDAVGAASLEAEFAYLGLSEKTFAADRDEARLSALRLQIEDGGAWAALQALLPAEFLDPELGPAQVSQALRARSPGALGPPASPAGRQAFEDFVASIEASWGGFLAAPTRLVLTSRIDPGKPVSLGALDINSDPTAVFAALRPILASHAAFAPLPAGAAEGGVLTAELVRTLNLPDGLSRVDLRQLAVALLTGVGAPRNTELDLEVLAEVPDYGGGATALLAAQSLAERDPERAYPIALTAAQEGTQGANALLDDLEPRLKAGTIFKLQVGLPGKGSEMPASIRGLRERASAHLTGRAGRSYVAAAYWARLAAAAGDRAALHMLDDLDDRMRALGIAAEWRALDHATAERALSDWIDLDLPRRVGLVAP